MNLSQEKKVLKEGFKIIVGLDEAGRGPISGPVTAAAVAMTGSDIEDGLLKGMNDSKKLSAEQRNHFYNLINECSNLEWATGRVGSKVIDRINILEASKLAMKRAIFNLNKNLDRPTDFLMIDGNFEINSDLKQRSFVRGDQKIFLIAAASVVAKVSRDRAMKRYHKMYPEYGFAQNKGYPTAFHRNKVKEIGPCEIHRKTFKPVRNVVE